MIRITEGIFELEDSNSVPNVLHSVDIVSVSEDGLVVSSIEKRKVKVTANSVIDVFGGLYVDKEEVSLVSVMCMIADTSLSSGERLKKFDVESSPDGEEYNFVGRVSKFQFVDFSGDVNDIRLSSFDIDDGVEAYAEVIIGYK
jgi:hypothetical protein